jgi:hypothetical protein
VSLLSPFSSLVMQTPIFFTNLSDESIVFIIDVGKKIPCLILPMSTKCQRNEKKITINDELMSYNMMIGYDIYDHFTMEHFPLCQKTILTTSFFARNGKYCQLPTFATNPSGVNLYCLLITKHGFLD